MTRMEFGEPQITQFKVNILAAYKEEKLEEMYTILRNTKWMRYFHKDEPLPEALHFHSHDFSKVPLTMLDIQLSIMKTLQEDEKVLQYMRERTKIEEEAKYEMDYVLECIRNREEYLKKSRKSRELGKGERQARLKLNVIVDETKLLDPKSIFQDLLSDPELIALDTALKTLEHVRVFYYSTETTYEFNRNRFVPIGGFKLPLDLEIGETLLNRIGEASLSNVTLRIKESPLGLRKIIISGNEDNNTATFTIVLKDEKKIMDALCSSLEIAKEIASLLVIEK